MPKGLLVGALRARRSLKLSAFSAGEAGVLGACSVTQTRSWHLSRQWNILLKFRSPEVPKNEGRETRRTFRSPFPQPAECSRRIFPGGFTKILEECFTDLGRGA